jgi:hypothetical protein
MRMSDTDYEDWLEGFSSVPPTSAELEDIKAGHRTLSEVDRRNLVREIQFLRFLSSELIKRCEEAGVTTYNNEFIRLAHFFMNGRS